MIESKLWYSILNTIIDKHIPEELYEELYVIFSAEHSFLIHGGHIEKQDIIQSLLAQLSIISTDTKSSMHFQTKESTIDYSTKIKNYFITLCKFLLKLEKYEFSENELLTVLEYSSKYIILQLQNKINIKEKENYGHQY